MKYTRLINQVYFSLLDENMTQKACRSFLQQMVPKSSADRVLKKTRVCTQRVADIKLPPGTRIRVNNNKHNLAPSTQEMMRHRSDTFLLQEFKYDLMNFNSEHFATFVRYGHAVCNQVSSVTWRYYMYNQTNWSSGAAMIKRLKEN